MIIESIGLLPAAGLLATTSDGAAWVLLGRLHPMLVHFPIAMILVAAALELVLLVRKPEQPSHIASFCVWVGTVFACLAIWCGWALGEESGGGDTLELHRWFGVAAGAVLVAVAICWLVERASHARWSFQSYRFGLWGGAVLLVITSAFGGDMVWGEDWLTGPLTSSNVVETVPSESVKRTDTAPVATPQASTLEPEVTALFAQHCEQCHGPTKQRGDLQLLPLQKAFPRGDEVVGVVQPGKPEASQLYKRITLPADHEDRMPPKGDPLTEAQVELVRNWIESGAPHGMEFEAASDDDAVVSDEPPTIEDRAAFDAGLQAIIERGGAVTALHQGSPWYEVNVSIAKPVWTDEDLALLSPIAVHLWSLNLGRSAVTDAGMASVASCKNLRVLKLNGTAVGDAGVLALVGLKHLQRLNVYGTQVGDSSIDAIERMPALTHVYLWDTKVTRLGLDTLRVARPSMNVDSGDGLGAPPPEVTPEPDVAPESDVAPEPDVAPESDVAPEPPPAPEVPESESAALPLPPCCQTAKDRGEECDHACCVEARATGEICPKCAVEG
jgi:uncharacterized membrane protein/mono/diheme cytochrome c family protein